MVKFVMATYLPKDAKIDIAKIDSVFKDTFSDKSNAVVILNLENISEETLKRFIDMGAIDCFSFTPESLNSEKGKSTISRVLAVNQKLNKNTKFVNIYDGQDEQSLQESTSLGNVLLDENCGATLSHFDINADSKILSQNLLGIQNSAVKERAIIQEREQYILDFTNKIVNDIESGKDEYTGKHIRSVCAIAEAIAQKIGISDSDIDLLKVGALLHDVGKQDVSDSVLKKPSHLTNEEFQEMKAHVLMGEIELNQYNLGDYERAKTIAAEHHEKYDGTGYPRGLKGDEIDILSRIVSIADSTQAMFGRSYQNGRTKDELIAELQRCSGTQFDPQMVDCLCNILETEPQLLYVSYDENGKIAYNVPTTQELIATTEQNRNTRKKTYFSDKPVI